MPDSPTGKHAREPRLHAKPLKRFGESLARGAVILCLMEGEDKPMAVGLGPLRGGSFDWLPVKQSVGVAVGRRASLRTEAVEHDSFLRLAPKVEQIPELARLLTSETQQVKSVRTLGGCEPLLLNESGHAKAGVVHSEGGGMLFLLPRFKRKPAAVHRFLGEILPSLNPELFPSRKQDWGHEDAYQLPGVLRIRRKREAAEAEYARKVEELDAVEATERLEQERFTRLLRAQGQELQRAVHDCLE